MTEIIRTWSFNRTLGRPSRAAVTGSYWPGENTLALRRQEMELYGHSVAALMSNGQIVYYHPKETSR